MFDDQMPLYRYFILIFFSLCNLESFSQLQGGTDNLSNSEAVKIVNQKSNECWALREKNPELAIAIANEGLQIAKKHNLDHLSVVFEGYIGVIYLHYLFDIKKAIPYFHRSLEGSLKYGDSIQLAFTYNNLGDAFMLTGNIPLALQYSENSLSIFRKYGHQMGTAYGYINLGLVYRNENRHHLAIDYFKKAIAIREEVGDSTGIASANLELAKTYLEEGHLELAMDMFKKSYGQHVELDNSSYAAYCLNGMATIFYLKKQYDKAFESFSEALEINRNNHHFYGLIDNYIGLALVYAQQNKEKEGEEVLSNALEISFELGLQSRILETYKTYGKFYRLLRKYAKAAESFDRFLVMYDSILSVQQFEILSEIQNNFEISQNLSNAKLEIENKKLERNYLVILILLMVLIVTAIIWRLYVQRNMNRKLRIANQGKDKLFSVISHDLKSPFNSLLGFSEILIEVLKNKEYENALEYAQVIKSSSNETLNLLNNLLTWARSQTGKVAYSQTLFPLNELFGEIQNYYNITSQKTNVLLKFNSSISHNILADQAILRIVITNIISNSFKYTQSGGEIVIDAHTTPSSIVIKVTDNGIGMTNKTLASIFSTHQNIESKLGIREEKGTGLGLSICQDLIKLHKGTISAVSKLNEGSTFIIEIPQ